VDRLYRPRNARGARRPVLLEQTFYLPVTAMQDESCAPLRILEQLYQRKLA